ncbi:MAG: ParA family protein [Nitrospirae bacterium]|nr:ParA family protein [Magnetococcales bacterium]HAT50880.1 hypothetical protein [Alphaproteobacteria bacterium]
MNGSELLLSWVDVARRLWKVSQPCEGGTDAAVPPKGLVYTQTFWDRLFMGVAPGVDHDAILAWLSGIFGPRWQKDEHGRSILLEAHGEALSHLPVEVRELDEEEMAEWRNTPFQPRFSPPRTVHFSRTSTPEPDPFPLDQPPVLAFHSFKGGVGRTLCALATTLAYTGHKKKILLIDADFEAPGISFLFEGRKPDPDFALADLLTMLHADPDPDGQDALATAIQGVSNQCLDNVFVLPCFRNLEESVSLEIRPEHLVASTAHHPFFLGDILSRLGKALRVDLVIVDLRAGLSELSAPLILDPRIKRILVANASGQSIKGTRFIIQEIGDTLKANQWPANNLPALILNQLPSVLMPKKGEPGNERFNAMVESIDEALMKAFPQREMSVAEKSELILPTTAEEGISKVTVSYNEPLAMLSDTWDDALETIRQSVIPEKIWDTLQLWLPATGEPVPKAKETSLSGTLDEGRKRLRDFAEKLVTAEGTSEGSIEGAGFLPILPLVHLAQDHVAKLPVVVSIGAKGAGKTYSFLNMVRCHHWNHFVERVKPDLNSAITAPILPVLWSKNADIQEMAELQDLCRKDVGIHLAGNSKPFELTRALSQLKHSDLYLWRDFWTNAIARSLGVPEDSSQPFETLISSLRQDKRQIVALIDGLEEAFPEFAVNPIQQTALRALLQEVPNWLRTLPGAPLGLVVFVRQDMVLHAIPQNRTQFTERFVNYALRWTWVEALELAAWVTDKSKATTNLWDEDFSKLSDAERTSRLKCLWGIKLGGDKTNEAISNNWVLSVLSDLRGRIQARDVVRFIGLAARKSVGNTKTGDRILAPAAMRDAIAECSQKKIDEISEENAPLKEIFDKIKGKDSSPTPLSSPCTYKKLASLSLTEGQIELLEENGIIFFDNSEKKYHFPEIFRYGLSVERAVGARPKVLSLMRKARNEGRF